MMFYLGNITDILVKDNADVEEYHYQYDNLNQLIREDLNLKGTTNDATYVYAYDINGNIKFKKKYSYQYGTIT